MTGLATVRLHCMMIVQEESCSRQQDCSANTKAVCTSRWQVVDMTGMCIQYYMLPLKACSLIH